MALVLLALASLAGCAADPAPPRASAPPTDSRALAADLDARLDALQRQQEPASDEVIASLERALREQREKRARAVVAAGTTAVIPSGNTTAGVAAPTVPLRPAAVAPVVVAAASTPSKPVHLTKAQARAASAAAARQAAAARRAAPAPALVMTPDVQVADGAMALPPVAPARAVEAIPLPTTVPTRAATVSGPARTPMSRTAESHVPVEELYARARELELQLQVVSAIGLYREASQRGHAPSSQRLMELYADGAPGVARDYRVAVFFKERAVQQGASFDPIWRR